MNRNEAPLRVLVIGAGPMAMSVHLPLLAGLRDSGELVLVHICDIQGERAAAARKKFKFLEAGGDADAALVRPDVDMVYIFGSAQMHLHYGLRALQAGKHLFIEKPAAPSYDGAMALADAAASARLVAVVGHNRRFHKSLAIVMQRGGKMRWQSAEAVFHKAEFGKPVAFGAASWLGANGIHALDAMIFAMGGLPEWLASLTGEGGPESNRFSALMRWPDGAQGAFLCNHQSGARRETYTFHAPGVSASISAEGLTVEQGGRREFVSSPALGDGYAAEHAAFLRSVRSGSESPHGIAAVAPSLFLAELIENGFNGPVRLPQARAVRRPEVAKTAASAILVVHPAPLQRALPRLMARHRLVTVEDVARSPDKRADIHAVLFGQGAPPLSADILDKLPHLRVAAIMGLSLGRYEPEQLLDRGVSLLNASEAYAESVAEFALGLAILGRRRAVLSHRIMRDGGWGTIQPRRGLKSALRRTARRLRPAARMLGLEQSLIATWRSVPWLRGQPCEMMLAVRDLKGATVGLIGWGSNARAFTRRLLQAGARVRVFSEWAGAEDIRTAGAVSASLADTLTLDIVSLHRGLNRNTRHFLGEAELALLRPGAVLINVARGALIEPGALLARLERGDVFACLDTFEDEPPPFFDPLRALPNVFLTSHIAGGSPDMHAAAAAEVVDKLVAYLDGAPVQPVTWQHLRTMS